MSISTKLDKNNVENILPISSMQRGMLFQLIMDSKSNLYFEQMCYRLRGEINIEIVKEAWNCVAKTNEMLRTVFRWKGISKPVQIILREYEVPVRYFDISKEDKSTLMRKLTDIKRSEMEERVDLCQGPFRVTICKLSKLEFEMIITTHHIIFDGWSNLILLKEFIDFYTQLFYKENITLPKKTKYKEYINSLGTIKNSKEQKFWTRYLDGYRSNCNVNKMHNNLKTPNKRGHYDYKLDQFLVEKITKYLRNNKISIASLLYGTWAIVEWEFNKINDVIIGISVSGRNIKIKGIENMVGLFINTIPLRMKLETNNKIPNFIKKINNTLIEMEEYQNCDYSDIKKYGNIGSNVNLFNTVFVIQNYPFQKPKVENGKCAIEVDLTTKEYETNMDLSIGVRAFNEEIKFELNYCIECFEEEYIKSMFDSYLEKLEKIISDDADKKSIQSIIRIERPSEVIMESEKIKSIESLREVDFSEIF